MQFDIALRRLIDLFRPTSDGVAVEISCCACLCCQRSALPWFPFRYQGVAHAVAVVSGHVEGVERRAFVGVETAVVVVGGEILQCGGNRESFSI